MHIGQSVASAALVAKNCPPRWAWVGIIVYGPFKSSYSFHFSTLSCIFLSLSSHLLYFPFPRHANWGAGTAKSMAA